VTLRFHGALERRLIVVNRGFCDGRNCNENCSNLNVVFPSVAFAASRSDDFGTQFKRGARVDKATLKRLHERLHRVT
jgi:hypothetical protein